MRLRVTNSGNLLLIFVFFCNFCNNYNFCNFCNNNSNVLFFKLTFKELKRSFLYHCLYRWLYKNTLETRKLYIYDVWKYKNENFLNAYRTSTSYKVLYLECCLPPSLQVAWGTLALNVDREVSYDSRHYTVT